MQSNMIGGPGPFEVAGVALRMLAALVRLQGARDAAGQRLHPLPLAHRQLASPDSLPHIAQAPFHNGI